MSQVNRNQTTTIQPIQKEQIFDAKDDSLSKELKVRLKSLRGDMDASKQLEEKMQKKEVTKKDVEQMRLQVRQKEQKLKINPIDRKEFLSKCNKTPSKTLGHNSVKKMASNGMPIDDAIKQHRNYGGIDPDQYRKDGPMASNAEKTARKKVAMNKLGITESQLKNLTGKDLEDKKKEIDKVADSLLPTPELWDAWEKAVDEESKRVPEFEKKGFFNTEVIPHEILQELGMSEKIPDDIKTAEQGRQYLHQEIKIYSDEKILPDHYNNLLHDLADMVFDQYQKAYPGNVENAYIVTRDLMRALVYEQRFEQRHFTGSHHGILHAVKNIEASMQLMASLRRFDEKAVTEKDLFLTMAMHILHDVGYTTGLSKVSFFHTKDHPIVGGAMIEKNADYFKHYFGNEGYETVKNCVKYHGIARAEIIVKPVSKEGIHYDTIRAISAIGDAVQVSAQDKLQEIWLQTPEVFDGLTELAHFCALYPEYMKPGQKLTSDKINEPDPFKLGVLDPNNPLDVIAYDIFKKSKNSIINAINRAHDKGQITDDVHSDFLGMMNSSFNSITASIVFGQLGLVIGDLSIVAKETRGSEKHYKPKIALYPSLVQGALKAVMDQFGKDRGPGEQNVQKVVAEFGGDSNRILTTMRQLRDKIEKKESPNPQTQESDFAAFEVHGRFDVEAIDNLPSHNSYKGAHERLVKLEGNAIKSDERSECRKDLEQFFSDLKKFRTGRLQPPEMIASLQNLSKYKKSIKNKATQLQNSSVALAQIRKDWNTALRPIVTKQFPILNSKEITQKLGNFIREKTKIVKRISKNDIEKFMLNDLKIDKKLVDEMLNEEKTLELQMRMQGLTEGQKATVRKAKDKRTEFQRILESKNATSIPEILQSAFPLQGIQGLLAKGRLSDDDLERVFTGQLAEMSKAKPEEALAKIIESIIDKGISTQQDLENILKDAGFSQSQINDVLQEPNLMSKLKDIADKDKKVTKEFEKIALEGVEEIFDLNTSRT